VCALYALALPPYIALAIRVVEDFDYIPSLRYLSGEFVKASTHLLGYLNKLEMTYWQQRPTNMSLHPKPSGFWYTGGSASLELPDGLSETPDTNHYLMLSLSTPNQLESLTETTCLVDIPVLTYLNANNVLPIYRDTDYGHGLGYHTYNGFEENRQINSWVDFQSHESFGGATSAEYTGISPDGSDSSLSEFSLAMIPSRLQQASILSAGSVSVSSPFPEMMGSPLFTESPFEFFAPIDHTISRPQNEAILPRGKNLQQDVYLLSSEELPRQVYYVLSY